jgi:hypothetical protein
MFLQAIRIREKRRIKNIEAAKGEGLVDSSLCPLDSNVLISNFLPNYPFMERTFFLMIGALIGVALVLATTTVYTQSVSAVYTGGGGSLGGAGTTDGQTAHGLATACANPTVGQINPNCHLPS